IKDLIESAPDAAMPGAFTYINVDRARTEGVESFIAYRPLETLTLRADYTYTEADNETSQQELLRIPRHKASLDAKWQATRDIELDATLLYVGPWFDVSRDSAIFEETAPDYTTVNIA